ncbi:hypothetical protein XENOCAPTIV_016307, partial [Xenoophorus captivus]
TLNSFKMSFSSCEELDSWLCEGNCSVLDLYVIDESRGEWCQKEYIVNISDTVLTILDAAADYLLLSANWTENRNGIVSMATAPLIDLRNRSDINKPNSSPQTTILPLLRVPSNCQRNINLLVSDPDGDTIRCRYAASPECETCTPPSVLTVSPSCTLSFSPTNSSDEGPYAVQLVIEDFPRQTITLTNSSGSQEVKTSSDVISKIPVQFVFRVDPAAPSCTEGLYLPRFLPPTPQNGAQISSNVNQILEISISAEATQAVITELLFSGPRNVAKSSSGSGNFTLTWTPSAGDEGLSHTFCFVVQANFSSSVYQSGLRCILVTILGSPTTTPVTTPAQSTTTTFAPPSTTTSPQPTTTTFAPPSTTTPAQSITTTFAPPSTTTPAQPTTTTPPFNITTLIPAPGSYYVLALNAKISTTLSLENDAGTITKLVSNLLDFSLIDNNQFHSCLKG